MHYFFVGVPPFFCVGCPIFIFIDGPKFFVLAGEKKRGEGGTFFFFFRFKILFLEGVQTLIFLMGEFLSFLWRSTYFILRGFTKKMGGWFQMKKK